MNEVIEALEQRRSCRKFSDKPVEGEKVKQIVEAGLYAASGMGRQATHLVVVTNPDDVAQLSRMNATIMGAEGDPFYGAKTVIVVLTDPAVPTCVEDGALVMGNLMNAAHALGRAGFTAPTRSLTPTRARHCSPNGVSRASGAEWATASWDTQTRAARSPLSSARRAASPTCDSP